MKGKNNTYRPDAGTVCQMSVPNEDDDAGYAYHETEILWSDDTFVVSKVAGCWPVVHKWDHVICKPNAETQRPMKPQEGRGE